MQKKKVELLAPAGNAEAFYGAIHAGADAIYLGGNRFGARAYADNFSEEELISCIRYAHLFNRKVYLTVNTLVKENEFSELYSYLCPFYEAGLDGVIIQDIGVFTYIRDMFPGMELHVSTQMTVTGKYSAALLQEMGACRVVPARELSLAEIKDIKTATGMEIECFIHGAMCYCYSGQCLFSSILGGRSGNRGRCAQPCRLPYSVKGQGYTSEECFPLSLKDMCTIERIPELIEAGIDSFKIEGRMKKPEYAAGVTAIYRKYIDKYYKNPHQPFRVSREDLDKLSKLYIRSERQDGYYNKHNGRDMVTLKSPAYSGSDEGLLYEIRKRYLENSPKLPVMVFGYFQPGEKAMVTYTCKDLSVTVEGEIVQPASKQPLSQENVVKQLGKLGDTVFDIEDMVVSLGEQAFYSLKALNELRREAVSQLEASLINANGFSVKRENHKYIEETKQKNDNFFRQEEFDNRREAKLHISVQTLAQLAAVKKSDYRNRITRVYINGDLFVGKDSPELWKMLEGWKAELIISMPYILRMRDASYLEELLRIAQENKDKIQGFRVSSLEAFGYLKSKAYHGKIYGDAGFYVWNHETMKSWEGKLAGFCMSLELKNGEQKLLMQGDSAKETLPCEKIFYGRIPMMLTANCVAKTTDACKKNTNEEQMLLIDRYQKAFPVVLNCVHCMNIIYNTVPLSLHNEWGKWKENCDMRLDFTIEKEKEVLEVLDFFGGLLAGEFNSKGSLPPYKEYTTGHEKRGVE